MAFSSQQPIRPAKIFPDHGDCLIVGRDDIGSHGDNLFLYDLYTDDLIVSRSVTPSLLYAAISPSKDYLVFYDGAYALPFSNLYFPKLPIPTNISISTGRYMQNVDINDAEDRAAVSGTSTDNGYRFYSWPDRTELTHVDFGVNYTGNKVVWVGNRKLVVAGGHLGSGQNYVYDFDTQLATQVGSPGRNFGAILKDPSRLYWYAIYDPNVGNYRVARYNWDSTTLDTLGTDPIVPGSYPSTFINDAVITADGNHIIIAASSSPYIFIAELTGLTRITNANLDQTQDAKALAISPTRDILYVALADGTIKTYDLSPGVVSAVEFENILPAVPDAECMVVRDGVSAPALSGCAGGSIVENWNLSSLSDPTKSFNAASQFPGSNEHISCVAFKSDGTKMYIGSYIYDGSAVRIWQYTLSIPWDVTTATYDTVSLDISSYIDAPHGLQFSAAGDKLYIVGDASGTNTALSPPERVAQFSLSVAWDISTATHDGTDLDLSGSVFSPRSLTLTTYGDYLYTLDSAGYLFRFALGTPCNLAGGQSGVTSLGLSAESTANPRGMRMQPNGKRFLIVDSNFNYTIYEYTLSVAHDLSTASLKRSVTLPASLDYPRDCFVGDGGTKLYICNDKNASDKRVVQLSI